MSKISEDPTAQDEVVHLGKYELIAQIGSGGMAQVFLARQTGPLAFQKIVVVKSIHDALVEAQGFVDMLLDEARIAGLIKHPNVVDIYDLGEADGRYYIAMEYIPGRPLSNVLGRSKGTSNYMHHNSVAHVIAEAADGLHAAHTLRSLSGEHLKIVHRDVTPGNIMVAFDGGVKLVDFGVAKSIGNIGSTQTGQLKGKLGYLSPEQINGLEVSAQTDVFSLGICLWESLVVARLFKGSTMGATIAEILNREVKPPSRYREEIPEELDRICIKALARDPKERYQSAAEMRDDLQAYLRKENHGQGRGAVAEYMELQFAEDIEADRLLVTQKNFAAIPAPIEDQELSSPHSRPSGSPAENAPFKNEITPTAELLAAAERSPLERFKEAPIGVKAAAGAGLIVFILVLRSLLGGGDADEKAQAAVDDAPPVTEVDEPAPAFVAPIPDAAIEPAIESIDAAVEVVVEAKPKPKFKPKPITKKAKGNALFISGKKKFAKGDLSGAKRDLSASLKLRPGHAGTHKAMARLYDKAGVKSKAVQHYRKYLKGNPRARDRSTIEARIKKLGG